MMDVPAIKPYTPGQEGAIHHLIKEVYDEFVSGDCTEEGNRLFYDWIAPERIAERQRNEINLRVATDRDAIVGMIEIRNRNIITLLFVDKAYQRRGIGKMLFREMLAECMHRDPAMTTFYVHASLFSVPVYEKLGFVASGNVTGEFGIRYLPMEMKVGA